MYGHPTITNGVPHNGYTVLHKCKKKNCQWIHDSPLYVIFMWINISKPWNLTTPQFGTTLSEGTAAYHPNQSTSLENWSFSQIGLQVSPSIKPLTLSGTSHKPQSISIRYSWSSFSNIFSIIFPWPFGLRPLGPLGPFGFQAQWRNCGRHVAASQPQTLPPW